MAINNKGVKLFESQRQTDKENDGGRVTGREVIDGGSMTTTFSGLLESNWNQIF